MPYWEEQGNLSNAQVALLAAVRNLPQGTNHALVTRQAAEFYKWLEGKR